MTTPRRALLTAGALGVLLAAGYLLPRHLLSDNVDRHAAPVERTVAAEALDLARITCLEHPATRLFVTVVRVTDVREVPDSCVLGLSRDSATAEFVAIVRTHGPFGLPMRSMRATCGGQAIAC
jgi:hypothetical protein